MATTTKNWVKWDLAAVYKDWKCCTHCPQRTSGFFPVGSQPWTNIPPPPPRPIISVCKKQGALEWDSWMCILAVLLNNCMDLGVFLILRKPHYPHLDMAVIMPTSLDSWKIKGDPACEMLSRTLACVKDLLSRVRVWFPFKGFTGKICCDEERRGHLFPFAQSWAGLACIRGSWSVSLL